jgi:arsenite methyltransferase
MSREVENHEIKEAVKKGYAEALARSSCCGSGAAGGSCSPSRPVQIGYTPGELAGLPGGAVGSSFGCGNPLALGGISPGDVVLDIGSGAGMDCLIAARRVGPKGRVIGLDMTPAMIERAQENAERAGLSNVEFRLGDAESMPVADASVNWVISNCVINLAPDKPKVFREIARVLAPGGRVSITDILLADELPALPEVLRHNLALVVACVGGAVRESEYLAAMRQAGLSEVEVTERSVYGESLIAETLQSLRSQLPGGDRLDGFFAELAQNADGKVWSARVLARKPLAAAADMVTIDRAGAADLPAIASLLAEAGLPASNIDAANVSFVAARDRGSLAGCGGVELYGDTALLRSLAVSPAYRERGLGGRLGAAMLEDARRSGARQAVILTHNLQRAATALGFAAVARETLPKAIRSSWELTADCCGAATCMALDLTGPERSTFQTGPGRDGRL